MDAREVVLAPGDSSAERKRHVPVALAVPRSYDAAVTAFITDSQGRGRLGSSLAPRRGPAT